LLQEEMLTIGDLSQSSNLLLDGGILLLIHAAYLNHGIDGTIFWTGNFFDFLDIDVSKIVTSSQLFDVGIASLSLLDELDFLIASFGISF